MVEHGQPSLRAPLAGLPYLVTEAVGALSGHPYYRRDDPQQVQQDQALLHARVMDKAASDHHYCGVLGWCAIDYASLNGRTYRHMKWPGVLDTFRTPKPGSAIYRSQVPPDNEVVIEPAFYWYFGEGCSLAELAEAMICSNCDELKVFLGTKVLARLHPDHRRFPNLQWPPFFLPTAGLATAARASEELTVEGYIDGHLAASSRMSADTSADRLELTTDDAEILADGVDLTRVVVRVTDRYGWTRPKAQGSVELALHGPGTLIGEERFALEDGGPVRAVWLQAKVGEPGQVRLVASHPNYGAVEAIVKTR